MKIIRLIFLFLGAILFSSSYSYANTPSDEICGNGFDDGASSGTWGSCPAGYHNTITGVGCDKDCPGDDKDLDGYTYNGTDGWEGRTWAYLVTGTGNSSVKFSARTGGVFGNSIKITFINPGSSHALSVSVASGTDINITLAHNGSAITSKARDIAIAIKNSAAAFALVYPTLNSGDGSGTVSALSQTSLSGGTAGSTNIDCDDGNPKVYPGVYVSCDAGTGANSGYKLCQTNGTYGSCVANATTPLCEATGTGVCKYINCSSGSDSNSGTYASPYLTPGKVSGGSGGTGLPASPYSLAAGDVAYLVGTGNCSTQFTADGNSVVMHLTRDGTSSNWITVKRYPGSTATINPSSGFGIYNTFGDYTKYDDLEVKDINSSTSGQPIGIREYNHARLSRIYIHDINGPATNNLSGINITATNDTQIRNSWFKDVKKHVSNGGNQDNVTCGPNWLDNSGSSNGADHGAWSVHCIYSVLDITLNGQLARQKHSVHENETGNQGTQIRWSSCVNCYVGIQWQSSGLRAQDNRFVVQSGETNGQYRKGVWFLDSGETWCAHQGNLVDHNTFIRTGRSILATCAEDNTENVIFTSNVLYEKDAWGDNSFLSLDRYFNDTVYNDFWGNGWWYSDNNVLYNPDATFQINDFSDTCSGSCPLGTIHTSLAAWQSAHGMDATSTVTEPTFDADLLVTGTGWREPSPSSVSTGGTLVNRLVGRYRLH